MRRTSQGVDQPGQRFQYAFDEIGNRTQTQRDQDRPTTWTANDLNQYTARQVSSNLHVFGRAVTSRTVTVAASNGAMTAAVSRIGAYFHSSLTVTNTFAPVWADILVRAIATNGVAETNNFQRLVEQTPELFAHDADGNLVEDGSWAYSWDAENRLTQAVARAAAVSAGAPNLKLVFAYDHMSRRIAKTVSAWTNGAWTQTSSRAFIYDGWNLAAETGGAYGLQTYAWGLDLSGTPQGAGGVGGLLGATLAATNGYVVGCDANGNVMLAVLDNGTLQSQMEYGPFAEALRVTEYAAPGANPFRFSTKYEDAEMGLLYYGYRYYSVVQGRWLARDPVFELCFQAAGPAKTDIARSMFEHASLKTELSAIRSGGFMSAGELPHPTSVREDAYLFVANDSLNCVDVNGLSEAEFWRLYRVINIGGGLVIGIMDVGFQKAVCSMLRVGDKIQVQSPSTRVANISLIPVIISTGYMLAMEFDKTICSCDVRIVAVPSPVGPVKHIPGPPEA